MSIKIKYGKCEDCNDGKEKALTAKRCQNHYWQYRRKVSAAKNESNGTIKVNKPSGIKTFSDKRLKQMAVYRKNRDKYMKENQICEVDDCNNKSNQLHHKKGREGKNLIDVKYFMACCGICHPRRIHETEVNWAKEKGYLLLR